MFKTFLKATALSVALLMPGVALAETSAIVTTDLNVRTGPGANYQRYGTIPVGDNVTVYGCLAGYNWCDVDWAGGRGWVSGSYLAYLGKRYSRQPISTIGIRVGVPVLGFDPYDYHRRYYTGRSWYRDRYLDREVRREIRRDIREDRRQDRREDRRDFREDPRDYREGVRDGRREFRDGIRDDVRGDRREFREDRRDLRDARGDVRDERRDVRDARQDVREEFRDGGDARQERRQLREERRELRGARRELIEERLD